MSAQPRRWHLITDRTIEAMVTCLEDGRLTVVKEELRDMLNRDGLSDDEMASVRRFLAVLIQRTR